MSPGGPCEANNLKVSYAMSICHDSLPGRGLYLQRPSVRAYACKRTMKAMDLGAELGDEDFRLWGWT